MSYVIAGRAIKSEFLAIGTLASAAAVALFSTSGEKQPAAAPSGQTPVGLAKEQGKVGLSEEEEFIQNFVAEAEKDDKH